MIFWKEIISTGCRIWKGLTERFQKDPVARERFDDYIPPYKNLGVIFIKAYRKAMGEEE